MTDPVTVILLGEPVAFARSRISRTGAHFTPAKQRNTMAALRIEAQQAMRDHGALMFDEPLRMDLRAEFQIPKSMAKRDKPLALIGTIRPGKKPDIDNLYKLAADALNTIVFRDDALIVEAALSKVYSGQPKLIITVTPIAQSPIADLVSGLVNDTLDTMIDAEAAR
jgi:Holliday junction resolvase RusA-like endonuclease